MNENAARPMRMSPRHANPTRNEPAVEKSERPSSPNSSPTIPPAGCVPKAVRPGLPTCTSAAVTTASSRSPAMRPAVAGLSLPRTSGMPMSMSSSGRAQATRPDQRHEGPRAERSDGPHPVGPRGRRRARRAGRVALVRRERERKKERERPEHERRDLARSAIRGRAAAEHGRDARVGGPGHRHVRQVRHARHAGGVREAVRPRLRSSRSHGRKLTLLALEGDRMGEKHRLRCPTREATMPNQGGQLPETIPVARRPA